MEAQRNVLLANRFAALERQLAAREFLESLTGLDRSMTQLNGLFGGSGAAWQG